MAEGSRGKQFLPPIVFRQEKISIRSPYVLILIDECRIKYY